MINLCRFFSGFQKCHFFLCTTIKNAKKIHFKNVTSSPLPVSLAIAQVKTKILLGNFVCVLFVYISITYNPFFENFPDFENISRNQNFGLKNLKILRLFNFGAFEIAVFLLGFLCLWPDFRVSRLLIWFSAIFFTINKFSAENGWTWPQVDLHISWPNMT